jgi:hypothetical protein
MRQGRHALLLGLMAGAVSCVWAQGPPLAAVSPAGVGEVQVKDARVADVDASHLKIAVDLVVKPTQTVTLENLRITGLRMNGLPLYADPLDQSLELKKGMEVSLPPVYVSVLFRDLTTVEPLRTMVDKQMAHLQGEIVAGVRMSFLQKLVLHTEHPRVSIHLSEDVPVTIGSSPLERAAALGLLSLVDAGLQGGREASKSFPELQQAWVRDLEMSAHANLVRVETRYELKKQDSDYPVLFDQIGFRLPSGVVVTTAESTAPWEFDSEFMGKIKAGEAKLKKNSYEMELRPAGKAEVGDESLLLSRKDFSVVERGGAEKDALLVDEGGVTRIELRKRTGPKAVAVLTLQKPLGPAGYAPAPDTVLQQDAWEKVAVFRLMQEGGVGKVEVVTLSARRDGDGIRLDRPVDGTIFGSPIVAPEGVLGLVQDEDTGAFLPDDVVAAARKTAGP